MNQKHLFTKEQNIDRNNDVLFGESGDKVTFLNSLGGNFHQLSDQKINKLISLKFKGNPIDLIRQLSNDLAVKESELIFLRKEKFIREQELIKLCAEYGNLSRLEIDNKLQNLNISENIDNTIVELIDDAIHADIYKLDTEMVEVNSLNGYKHNHDKHSDLNLNHKNNSKKDSNIRNISESTVKSNDEAPSHSSIYPKENKSNWLKYWFNSSDDLNSYSLKSKARSFPNILSSLPNISKNTSSKYDNRVPLELESIDTNDDSYKLNSGGCVDIDKYGFLKDMPKTQSKLPLEKIENKDQTTPICNSKHTEKLNGLSKMNSSVTKLVVDLDITGTASVSSNQTIDLLREIGKLHDTQNQELEHQWDVFFNGILRDIYRRDIIDNGNTKSSSNKDTQISNTSISGILNQNLKHYKTLRNFINYSGIPTKYRYGLWFELSGACNLKVNGEFELFYQAATQTDDKVILSHLRQIDLDIHRTMPSNIYFHDILNSQPGPHLNKLKKILYAFAYYRKDIGYSQGMNKIVGNLLLVDKRLNEEDTFWIFIGLVENILPHYNDSVSYFDPRSLDYIRTDQIIMKDILFPKLMPKLSKHFQSLNIQLEFITINWWLSLFTDNFLNIEIWFKIFDTLLVSDVELKLFSLSLAIFKALEKFLINIKDQNGIYLAMKDLQHSNFTKINLRYLELMEISSQMEKKISKDELHLLRKNHLNLTGIHAK